MKEWNCICNHVLLSKASQSYVKHLEKILNVIHHPEFIFSDKVHGYLTNFFSFTHLVLQRLSI